MHLYSGGEHCTWYNLFAQAYAEALVGCYLSFSTAPQLHQLDVSNNLLTGTLPSSWGNLTKASTMIIVYVLAIACVRHCITLQAVENLGTGFAV